MGASTTTAAAAARTATTTGWQQTTTRLFAWLVARQVAFTALGPSVRFLKLRQ